VGKILSVGAVENQSEVVVGGTVVAEQGTLSAEGGGQLMGLQNLLLPAAAAAGTEGFAAGIVAVVVAVGIGEIAAGIEDSAAGIGGCYSPSVEDIGSQPPTAP
jgi:hypothetical protein